MERGGLQDLKRAAAVPHRRTRDSDANRFFVQLCRRVDHESAVSRRSERVAALSDFLAWVHARQERGNQASVVTAVSVGRAELFLLRVLAWFLVEAQNVVVFNTPRGDAASRGGVGRGQRQQHQAKSTRLLSMQAAAILAFLQHAEDRHFFVPSIIGSGAVSVFAHVLTPDWQPGVPEEDEVRRAVLTVFGRLVEPGATADDNGYKALLCESVQLVRVTFECLRELVSDSACEAAGGLLLSLFQGHDEKREREVLRGLAELLGGGAKSASTSVLLQRHAVRIFHRLLADVEEFPPPHSSARDADIVAPILKRVAEIAFSIPASGAASVLDFSEASKQKVAGEQAVVVVADAKEQDDGAQLSLVDKQFSFCASGTSPEEDDMSASTVLAPRETSFGLVGSCTPRLPTLLTTPSTRSLSERAVAMHRDICGGGDEGENPSLAAARALDPDAGTALSKTRAALSSARIPRSSHPYFFACPPVVREGAPSEALESLDVLVAPPARGASLGKPASAPMEQLEAGRTTAALSSDVSLATDALQCLKSSVAALDGDVLGLREKLLAHLTADLPAHLAQLEIDASREIGGRGSAVGVDVVGRCARILRGQTSSTASVMSADASAEVGDVSCPLIRLMAEHQQQQPVSWSPLEVPLPAALLTEVLRHDGADFFAAELRPSTDYGLFEARFGQFYSLVLMWDFLLHLLARDLDALRARKVPAGDLPAFATHLLCYCLDVGRAPLFLQQSAFWYLKQLLCIAERVAVQSLHPRRLLHMKLEAMIRNSSDVCDLLAPTAWGKNAASDAGTYRFGCKRRPAHENMDDVKHLKEHLAQLRFWLRNKDLVRLGRELEVQQIALARDVDEVTRNSQEEVFGSTDLLSLVDVTPPLQLQLSEDVSLRAAIPDFRIPRPLSGVRWLCERELLLRAALEVRNTVAIPCGARIGSSSAPADFRLDEAALRLLEVVRGAGAAHLLEEAYQALLPLAAASIVQANKGNRGTITAGARRREDIADNIARFFRSMRFTKRDPAQDAELRRREQLKRRTRKANLVAPNKNAGSGAHNSISRTGGFESGEFDDIDLDGASARQLIPIATTNVQRIVPDYVDVFFPRDDVSESSIATRSSMFPRFGFELESQLSASSRALSDRGCDDVADRREEDVTSGEKKDCNPLPPVKMCWTSSRLHGRKVGVNNERNSVAPGVTTAVLSSCTNSALGARSARQRGMTTRPDSGVVVQSGAAHQAPVCGANALVVGFGTASAVPVLRPRRKKLVHDYNYSRNYSDYPAARVGGRPGRKQSLDAVSITSLEAPSESDGVRVRGSSTAQVRLSKVELEDTDLPAEDDVASRMIQDAQQQHSAEGGGPQRADEDNEAKKTFGVDGRGAQNRSGHLEREESKSSTPGRTTAARPSRQMQIPRGGRVSSVGGGTVCSGSVVPTPRRENQRQAPRLPPLYEEWAYMLLWQKQGALSDRFLEADDAEAGGHCGRDRQGEVSTSNGGGESSFGPRPAAGEEAPSTASDSLQQVESTGITTRRAPLPPKHPSDYDVLAREKMLRQYHMVSNEFPPSPPTKERAARLEERISFLQSFSKKQLRELEAEAFEDFGQVCGGGAVEALNVES